MRTIVRSSSSWSPSSIELLHTRLDFALGRFNGRVRSLTVQLKDLDGPRGDVDKQCLIALRLDRPRRVIVIEDVDTDEAAAISRAAERAARAVARALQTSGERRPLGRRS